MGRPTNLPELVTLTVARKWPTPKCQDERSALTDRGKYNFGEVVHGHESNLGAKRLNPDWIEWLMGWPIGWTDITKSCEGDALSWSTDPADDGRIPRVTERRDYRANRIKCLGNGQVPAAMALAYEVLKKGK